MKPWTASKTFWKQKASTPTCDARAVATFLPRAGNLPRARKNLISQRLMRAKTPLLWELLLDDHSLEVPGRLRRMRCVVASRTSSLESAAAVGRRRERQWLNRAR